MPKKISDFTAITTPDDTAEVYVRDGTADPVDRKWSASNIYTWLRSKFSSDVIEVTEGGTGASDAATARTNLGVTAANVGISAFGAAIVDDADAPAVRSTLGLGSAAVLDQGVNPTDLLNNSQLDTRLGTAGNLGTAAQEDISAYGVTLIDDTDAATARATLGLGSAAVENISVYGTSLIDDEDAATARTTLGLGSAALETATDLAFLGDNVEFKRVVEDIRAISADYTILSTDENVFAIDTSAGDITITLPDLTASAGRKIYLINIGAANNLVVNAAGADTIGADADTTINIATTVTTTILVATGSYWEVVSTGGGGSSGFDVVPIGTVFPHGASTAPVGALAADGSAVSRAQYAELFDAIGTTWGVGDGSTTFNLPDLRGLSVRGAGTNASRTKADGTAYAGPAVGSYEDDQFQEHAHNGSLAGTGATFANTRVFGVGPAGKGSATASVSTSATTPSGSGVSGPAVQVTGFGTPRTGDETRGASAGVLWCIKASRITATGEPITALRYDTGWVAHSDWSNAELAVSHNLGSPIGELITKIYFSSDGTDATAVEMHQAVMGVTSGIDTGYQLITTNDNEFKVQTGATGVRLLDELGARVSLVNGVPYYYRVVVYKPEIIARVSEASVRSVSADYTISGRADSPIISVTTGATDRTITLPAGSVMTPGDKLKVLKADSGAGKVTLARAGADTIDGVTGVDIDSQYDYAEVEWSGTFWTLTQYKDHGSNADGSFERRSDGSMSCRAILPNTTSGWETWSFPAVFTGTSDLTCFASVMQSQTVVILFRNKAINQVEWTPVATSTEAIIGSAGDYSMESHGRWRA